MQKHRRGADVVPGRRALAAEARPDPASDGWGAEKPLPAFFARVIEEAGCTAGSVLYVGDRLDNDIRPAQHAGMNTALIRRGPWGFIVEDETVSSRCLFRLIGLAELPGLIREHNALQG